MGKILVVIRLILLLMLSTFGVQASGYSLTTSLSYNNDVVEYFVIDQNTESEAQNNDYDDMLNLRYGRSGSLNNDSQEKTRLRSFFDFGEIFIVAKSGVYKNSLDYVGDTHVYRIKGSDGTYKVGESAQGLRKRDGASTRAESQVRKLQRETGEIYESKILKKFGDKRSAVEYQDRLRDRFRRRFGNETLPGNKEHLRGKKK